MFMSEDEAHRKWCPFARSIGKLEIQDGMYRATAVPYNRDHPSGQIPSCIASSCSAWRWAEPKVIRDIDLVTSDVVQSRPRLGYCGLSGKPEYGE
jgi:hypothetical protein